MVVRIRIEREGDRTAHAQQKKEGCGGYGIESGQTVIERGKTSCENRGQGQGDGMKWLDLENQEEHNSNNGQTGISRQHPAGVGPGRGDKIFSRHRFHQFL